MGDLIKFVRMYADAEGGSHFRDERMRTEEFDFASPTPSVSITAPAQVGRVYFATAPEGWCSAGHTAPARQLQAVLRGELEVTTTDGEVRRFGAGDIILAEDTEGLGHATRVVRGPVVTMVTPLGPA